MNTFSLLYSSIIRSSIWIQESKETRLVWVTMLALKDRDGNVYSSVVGLADSAKVSVDECKLALAVLMSPDQNDTSKVDEGRRIREIRGGWQVINHDLYRFSTEARRELWRQQQAAHRAKKALKQEKEPSGAYRSRESRAVKHLENGDINSFEAACAEGTTAKPKTRKHHDKATKTTTETGQEERTILD